MPTALEELEAHATDRMDAARAWRAGGSPVVGYMGADVPVEILTAAGALGVRLCGEPGTEHGVGERYLGRGIDPAVRSVLTRLVEGGFDGLDAVVVSRDCEASARLFYALRELRRISPEQVPVPVHLVDVLHLPHRTTTRYVQAKLTQFREVVRSWTGAPVDDGDLASAIRAHDRLRVLLAQSAALRRGARARLTGTSFLQVVAASTVCPVERSIALLERLLDEAPGLPEVGGMPVFATGSGHDTPAVYAALEGCGLRIAGEDHDWGDRLFHRLVGEPTQAALAERYQYNGPSSARASIGWRAAHPAAPARACGAEALLGYMREQDNAPPWDFAAQRTAAGLPAVLLDGQPYGGLTAQARSDAAALADTTRRAR
jgi:benzoyl-CoA reductase/2-hydroxyglutaryl-CoA dehydratase subunit BcrC/BadD/HgdB